jgi:hypothetical protein
MANQLIACRNKKIQRSQHPYFALHPRPPVATVVLKQHILSSSIDRFDDTPAKFAVYASIDRFDDTPAKFVRNWGGSFLFHFSPFHFGSSKE